MSGRPRWVVSAVPPTPRRCACAIPTRPSTGAGRPAGREAREVFNTVEQVRVETLGSRRLAGVAENLSAHLEQRCRTKGYRDVTEREDAQLAEVIGLLLREKLTGASPPESAAGMVDLWRSLIHERVGRELGMLSERVYDQESFAKIMTELIRALDLADDGDGGSEDDADGDENADGLEEDGGDGRRLGHGSR